MYFLLQFCSCASSLRRTESIDWKSRQGLSFLELGSVGRAEPSLYILSVMGVILFYLFETIALGRLMVWMLQQGLLSMNWAGRTYTGLYPIPDYVICNLAVIVPLIAIFIAVKFIHKRPLISLIRLQIE